MLPVGEKPAAPATDETAHSSIQVSARHRAGELPAGSFASAIIDAWVAVPIYPKGA
jgi:hypothetical protein